MKKITKLTKAQVQRIPEWIDKWIAIGLSTEPADFEKATEAAFRAYRLCNLDKPMVVLRMANPYAATIGGPLAWMFLRETFLKSTKVEQQVEQEVEQQVRQQVRQQVEQQVWQQVQQQVRQQVQQQVRQQVRQQVQQQVWQQVWQQVQQQVQQQVWQLSSSVMKGFTNYGINQLWASWGAYVSFFRDVCGWSDPILDRFEIAESLIKSCGWTWWHQNVLAISDRPKRIAHDESGRLHHAEKLAIEYRDGWGFCAWHGVVVPSEWIIEKKLTPAQALKHQNIEQRRAACEILGWAEILDQLNARVIDRNDSEQIGVLVEVDLPDSGKERFLDVRCGTGRRFVIPIPREMRTAHEANAWTWGLTPELYNPEVRT